MYEFIDSCLRHKNEMVIYEAASTIVSLKCVSPKELSSAVNVLQLFISSPKPVLRYAAVRTLNKVRSIFIDLSVKKLFYFPLKVAIQYPAAVTACNVDLETLITDSNRSIATLAITTLLKVIDLVRLLLLH
jgi:coatomer protein complex subunit gamma